MRLGFAILAAAVLAAAAAHAQEAIPRWSLIGAETVGDGQHAISAEIGWPGVSLGWTHGVTAYTDVGLRFDLLYAIDDTTHTRFGLGARVPLRAVAVRGDLASLFVHMDPGFSAYPSDPSRWGIRLPVGGAVGFQVTPQSRFALSMEIPITFVVQPGASIDIGTQFGASYEWFTDRHVLVGFDSRFGPVFHSAGGGSDVGFVARLVVAYRM
jgi:opacity protein-like surface antigen